MTMTHTTAQQPTAQHRTSLARRLGILLAGLALGTAAAGVGSPALAAPGDPTDGLDYVALGDSYASGYGLDSYGVTVGCARSDDNYPHQIAAALGLDLTDVTCSGATTAHILDTAQTTDDGISHPPQLSALSADTDIVTVTIGGNDLGFASIAATCAAMGDAGPTVMTFLDASPLLNCKSYFAPDGGTDLLATLVDTTVESALRATLQAIQTAAPNAKVFLVAYPALTPRADAIPAGTPCFEPVAELEGFSLTLHSDAYPFTSVDVAYLHEVQGKLDDMMNTVADEEGVTFVPMFAATSALTRCANPTGAYVAGVGASDAMPGVLVPDLPMPVYIEHGALHPTALGATAMADAAAASIEAAMEAPAITSGAPADGEVGDAYAFTVTASGFPAPTFAVAGGALPAGLSLNATTGQISGTPTAGGDFSFSISATNSSGTATSASYAVTVIEEPAITSAAPSDGQAGVAYSFTVTASGTPAPSFSIVAGALPTGLTLDPTTGEISGTVGAAVTSSFTVEASNAAGSVSAEYVIEFAEAPAGPGGDDDDTDDTDAGEPAGEGDDSELGATGADPAGALALGLFALLAGALVLGTRRIARRG